MKALNVLLLLVCCFFVLALDKDKDKDKEPNKKEISKIDQIIVNKKDRSLGVYYKNKLLKTYKIALGFSPIGHKEEEGDGKTPEGTYYVMHKNSKSRFHLSLKVSYPSKSDIKNAKDKGVNPGGDIMIHGLSREFSHLGKFHINKDWTLGCIAVTDEEISEIYNAVEVGVPIIILR